MRILTRYLIRSHLGPFLFAVSTLSGLLLINVVAQRFKDLAGKGLSWSVILNVFALSIPHTLALTVPMAVLVAVLYAFGNLAAENEITALKASGVNVARLLVPLLLCATLLTVGMVYFMDRVLPETNHQLSNLLIDIARKSPTLQLKEQVINEIQAGDLRSRYYLQAARIDPATNRLSDVAIYDMSDPERYRTIYADSGKMAFNRARTDLFLTLYNGWIHEVGQEEPDQFQRVFYDEQRLRIADVGNQLQRSQDQYRSDREMTMAMLSQDIAGASADLAKVRQETADLSQETVSDALAGQGRHRELDDTTAERFTPAMSEGAAAHDPLTQRVRSRLMTLGDEARALQVRVNQRRVEWWKKIAIPVACIVFVLIGVPLAIRFPRGGVGMVIAVSVSIFGVYYVGLIGGESLGDTGKVSPFLAMFAANIVFLILGLIGVSRLGKVMATSRGGGWDDFWYSLRSLVQRPLRALRRS